MNSSSSDPQGCGSDPHVGSTAGDGSSGLSGHWGYGLGRETRICLLGGTPISEDLAQVCR